jgi:hypothetical protein
MGRRWLITHRIIALVKFPIFTIGILNAHYFTETISQTVNCFDDVFSQLHRFCCFSVRFCKIMVKFSEKLSCIVNLLTSDLVLIKTKTPKDVQHDVSFP